MNKQNTKSYCRKFGINELQKRLEKIGGLNQAFMANTPEEAGLHYGYNDHSNSNPYINQLYAEAIDVSVFSPVYSSMDFILDSRNLIKKIC